MGFMGMWSMLSKTPAGLSEYSVNTSISWFVSFYSEAAVRESQYSLCVPVNNDANGQLRLTL